MTTTSKRGRRTALAMLTAAALAPVGLAAAQEPGPTPTPIPAGCVVTSAGLTCGEVEPTVTAGPSEVPTIPPPKPTVTPKPHPTITVTPTPTSTSTGEVRRITIRRLAFTGGPALPLALLGVTLLGGGLLLRRSSRAS